VKEVRFEGDQGLSITQRNVFRFAEDDRITDQRLYIN